MSDPVWCVDSNAWLRFTIAVDGRATAQIARIEGGNPSLTKPWENVASGTWHVFNGKAYQQHHYYSLHKGFLYKTDGILSPITRRITVAQILPTMQRQARINPFESYSFPNTTTAADFRPPLTPEQLIEKWNALQHDIYQRHKNAADPYDFFNDAQRLELIDQLSHIPNLDLTLYPTPTACLTALREIIWNTTNETHEALIRQAGRTVDDRTIPNDAAFLAGKKTFFFNLLETIYNSIYQEFSPRASTITPAPALPLPPATAVSGGSETPSALLLQIKAAVDAAQTNYAAWYEGLSHRGANGFFSWMRHGSYGQNRARMFNLEILRTTSDESAIALVKNLLTDSKTRYNRHSFASFLLDTLNTISDSPWSALSLAPASGMYDKNRVIAHLTPVVPPCSSTMVI